MLTQADLQVPTLGHRTVNSPLYYMASESDLHCGFVSDDIRIRHDVEVGPNSDSGNLLSFEQAGPREKIYFNSAETSAAIVTCGGLAPGLNNVIRSVVKELRENYGVQRILGMRNGYLGLNPESGLSPIELTDAFVDEIHKLGGTVLGTSRGPQDIKTMVDYLVELKVNILFCLGGDGTQRGAHALSQEVQQRNLNISVIGIPKTIDNDINYVDITFGYTTALEKAAEVIRGAHVEARGVVNGIGLVKLMGRDAGFIAAGASVISQEVDFTLVPEVDFHLHGDKGLLKALETRMRNRGHAVIVVAEGAGQQHFDQDEIIRDASGNIRHKDIGTLLRKEIPEYLSERGIKATIRFIDPSYFIRSIPANAYDRYLSDALARNAVHAAMAGRTGMMIGSTHRRMIHVPIPAVVASKKKMDVTGDLWRAVLKATGQPIW